MKYFFFKGKEVWSVKKLEMYPKNADASTINKYMHDLEADPLNTGYILIHGSASRTK